MPFPDDDAHIGRSHHTGLQAAISIVGGFAASFLAFSVTTYTQQYGGMHGQLLAGDPSANRELPTTLNAMRSAADGSNPILHAMTSYGWWTAVVIGGMIASVIVFKLMRRYV